MGRSPEEMIAYDTVYIVGTVNIRTVTYRMVNHLPKSLKPNEFAYKLELQCELDAWKSRILDVKLPPIVPKVTDTLRIIQKETFTGKSLGEIAIDRMSQ